MYGSEFNNIFINTIYSVIHESPRKIRWKQYMYQHKLTISNNVAPLYMMYNINANVHCTTFFEPNANLHLFDSKNYSKNGKYNLP